MTLQWLLSWWNLIFVLPFGLALIYLGLYTISGVTFGEADVDHDFDADADADAEADVDHDIDGPHAEANTDGDGDAEGDSDADAESDFHEATAGEHSVTGGSSGGSLALHWLGVGRVPLSMTLMVLLMTWGWIGFVANVLLQPHVRLPWQVAIGSVPAAAIVSLLLTRLLVEAIARWLPLCDTSARRRHELLGCVGEAIYPIDERFGMATLRDDQRDLFQVPCQTAPGMPRIAKGQRVKLVAYSARQDMFRVIPWT